MSNKLTLSVLSAVFVLGAAAPAFAQKGGRNADNDRGRDTNYSQSDNRRGEANSRRDYNARDSRSDRSRDYRRSQTRKVFNTRYRATIVLTESYLSGRRGGRQVCTVTVRGPQARYIPKKKVRRIAKNNCSRWAKIRI
ncbi:MAG: hypothetical protein HKN14_06715 [Marinicaulis sp.]|nr:hypothetical protein [Marinicaulis sp.]